MAADTSNKASSPGRMPLITLLVALLLAGGAGFMHSQSKQASIHFLERQAEARQFFDEHLYLEVDHNLASLLEGAQFARRRIYLSEWEETKGSPVPALRMRREKQQLARLVDDAVEARASLPPGRYGVMSTSDAPKKFFLHAAAHETGVAVCITLIVLLVAGMALENAWGHVLFGLFCAASTAGLALLRAESAPPLELPWAGSSGFAAAILGAYLALTLRGLARYFGGLLSGWLLVPLWVASQYALVDHFWQPGFDRSLFFIHGVGAAGGFALASLISAIGLERHGDGSRKKTSPVTRALGQARRAKSSGQEGHALSLLRAEAERSPANPEIVAALWDLAKELGQEDVAASAVMDLAQRALRENCTSDATKLWMDLVTAGVMPRVEPLVMVCMGEALLDEGHPIAAVDAMRLATESDEPIVAALALRIVKVARDLDPDLTRVSAELALADPRLPKKERGALEALASSAARALGETPAPRTGRATSSPDDSHDIDLAGELPERAADDALDPAELNVAALDPDAISEDDLQEFFREGGGEIGLAADDDEIARWNDPGMVEGLGEESDADAQTDEIDEDSTDTMAMGLTPGEIDDPFESGDLFESAEPSPSIGTAAESEAAGPETIDTAVQFETPPSRLRVVNVIPVALEDGGLVLEVDGQGKTCLPYGRVEAIAVGAVDGISEKTVIVVDLVLNWLSFAGEDIRVLRVRCDGFDPRWVMPADSPLESLTALLEALLERTGAAALPDAESARGKKFARFASMHEYEANVLRASSSS